MSKHTLQENTTSDYPLEVVNLFEIWNVVWKRKWQGIGITLVFSVVAVIYSITAEEIYRSEALLAPAEIRQPTNPLISQLGTAAGLVGINVNPDQGNQVTVAIATLQSRDFIRRFVERHDLLVPLFASNWDKDSQQSFVDTNIYDEATNTWLDEPPSNAQVYSMFSGILSINEDLVTNLITIAIEWRDPYQAKDWVTWLAQDINELIKDQDLQEATSAIEYLQKQLQSTQLVEMQQAFYQLIEAQTRIVMLADVRDDYVFRVIDPAYIPESRVRPNRFVIVAFGTLLGMGVSLIVLLFLNARQIQGSSKET